jgi:hypothetical protein
MELGHWAKESINKKQKMESKDKNEEDSIMTTKESKTHVLMVDNFAIGKWESLNTYFFQD